MQVGTASLLPRTDDRVAACDEQETFGFAGGSVLVKSFALPANNQLPGINEEIIETRLSIRREAGGAVVPILKRWT